MAASPSICPQSSRKFITAASSLLVADPHCAAPQSVIFTHTRASSDSVAALCSEVDAWSQGHNHSLSMETGASRQVVPRIREPSTPTSSTILPDRSRGSRPSLDSTKSSSSTGSSMRSDKLFDSPLCSPFWDSPQTSPEPADPDEDEAFPFEGRPKTKHRTIKEKSQEVYYTESPARAAGERKRFSTKDRAAPPLPKEASLSSNRLRVPAIERPRSSSAPSVPSPTNLRSSSIDPISLEIERCLIPGIANLALRDKHDETRSPRTARAASASLGKPTGECMGRPSSASGRVEKGIITEAKMGPMRSGPDRHLGDGMDREASLRFQWPKPEKDSQLSKPASPSTATTEEREGAKIVLEDSSISSSSVRTTATRIASRRSETPLPLQKETTEDAIPRAIHYVQEKSSPRTLRPVDRPGDLPESLPTQQSLGNAGSFAVDDPEADIDLVADILSDADAESEADSISEADTESEADAVSDVDATPAANEEIQDSDFKKFHNNIYHQTDIRAELMSIINQKPTKKRVLKKLKRGYIYVYSFSSYIRAATAITEQETEEEYKFFKVGLTEGTPPKRRSQQKSCGFTLIPIKDEKQRPFKFAGIVDDLIKCDLRNYRRKVPCKTLMHKKPGGSPSMHGEWYEDTLQHVLDCIEKWRGWTTKCGPFDSNGSLKPRWVWKLTILNQDKDEVDLDRAIQPFTWVENLSYRTYRLTRQCSDFNAQVKALGEVMRKSTLVGFLLLVVLLVLFLFYTLGLKLGLSCSALLITLVVYVSSAR